MKKIYLASASKARKELLKRVGLKFKVLSVKVRELRSRGNLSYAELVKRNALNKAKAAAIKVKRGIIIAADTITVEGGKIFGKPKNLKQARVMLKRLSAAPQDVYTGLAVIDAENSKAIVAAEKTRVYMHRLSDKEISAYFSRVSPLDKAGSFDIQGRGAFFIRKLEGCFYNVVGLPLARLYRMLRRLDVKLFSLFFSLTAAGIVLGGCSTEYSVVTGQEEQYYYSTEREVQMGRSISKQVAEQLKIAQDPLMTKRVKDIGKKIVAVCDRKDIDYEFDVIDDPEVNAFSLPGGFVYVNSGLVEKVANDDELAGVIGHEVGHIVARHSIKRLQGSQLSTLLMVLVSQAPSSGQVATAADAAITQLMLGYSREDEFLADQLGTRYLKKAGYNPQAMLTFLQTLQKIDKKRPLQPINSYKTHPYVPDRIRVVRQELGGHMRFNDYINIQDVPHN